MFGARIGLGPVVTRMRIDIAQDGRLPIWLTVGTVKLAQEDGRGR